MGRWVQDIEKTEENRKDIHTPFCSVWHCDQCGNDPSPAGYGCDDAWLSPFCPWCGAEMENCAEGQAVADAIDKEIRQERSIKLEKFFDGMKK